MIHDPWFIYTLGINANFIIAYLLEYPASTGRWPGLFLTLHLLNAVSSFGIPWAGLWYLGASPGGCLLTLVFATVGMMKIVSFALVSHELRRLAATKDQRFRASLGQLYYFVGAPTLVFSVAYPRSERVRKKWVVRRVVEFIGIWGAIYFIGVQYISPGLRNTLRPLEMREPLWDAIFVAEGLLKIAVPNFIVWILGFYSIFHLYLNILAELMRFGDREFYRDWWNSTTVGFFWRTWNLPVHTWMVAHVYLPLTHRRWSKRSASLVIFLLSAVLHELIVSIPFRNFKLLAFGGMMAQVPLIQATERFKSTQMGNVIFWLSIMLGQPMIVLLYGRDHVKGLCGPWNEADTAFWTALLSAAKTNTTAQS